MHAWLVQERGQGTVEYVGLILLLGVILAGVVAAGEKMNDTGIATTIVDKLKDAIDERRRDRRRTAGGACQTGGVVARSHVRACARSDRT